MLLIGLILVGLSVGNLLSMSIIVGLGNYFNDFSFNQFSELLQHPDKIVHGWWYLMLIQVFTHSFTFLAPCLIYWKWVEKYNFTGIINRPKPSLSYFFSVAVLIISFIPLNSIIIEWNNNMHLPIGLGKIEEWMKSKELELSQLTNFLTDFSSFHKLVVALFVVAVIPALGEEILFRGIIQRKIFNKTQSHHFSIWITAILFSAIHLQFYGFIPRMFLGALFGYLYIWSANLWVPIFAHFVNNGITLLMFFLANRKMVTNGLEDSIHNSIPNSAILISSIVFLLTLYLIRKNNINKPISINSDARQLG